MPAPCLHRSLCSLTNHERRTLELLLCQNIDVTAHGGHHQHRTAPKPCAAPPPSSALTVQLPPAPPSSALRSCPPPSVISVLCGLRNPCGYPHVFTAMAASCKMNAAKMQFTARLASMHGQNPIGRSYVRCGRPSGMAYRPARCERISSTVRHTVQHGARGFARDELSSVSGLAGASWTARLHCAHYYYLPHGPGQQPRPPALQRHPCSDAIQLTTPNTAAASPKPKALSPNPTSGC